MKEELASFSSDRSKEDDINSGSHSLHFSLFFFNNFSSISHKFSFNIYKLFSLNYIF